MRRSTLVLVSVSAATFMHTFDGGAVQMVLPALATELSVDVGAVHWAMTAFLLVETAWLLPAGRVGDVVGRERAWRASLVCFVVGSAICAMAPGLRVLVGGRVIQGIGAALAAANAAPVVVQAFPRAPGKALGLGNVAIALGLMAGPPLGSLFTRALSWRLIFVVSVPIGAAMWVVTRGRLPVSPRQGRDLDPLGGLLSVVALGALVIAATFGGAWGWGGARTLACAAIFVVALASFVVQEARAASPLVDRALLADRTFVSGGLATLFAYTALFALTFSMPFFLFLAQHRDLVAAGLLVGLVPLALSITGPLAGLLADRFGSRWLPSLGLVAIAAGLALQLEAGVATGAGSLAITFVLTGIGVGAFEPANDAAVLGSVPVARLGVATATLGALRNLGMTLGTATAAAILDDRMRSGAGSREARAAESLRVTVLLGIAAALLGAGAVVLRPSRAPRGGACD